MHSILWQWIENCFKCCFREKLLSAERSSLLAGLWTHSRSVFGSAGCFLTLASAYVLEAGLYRRCCKYTAGFTPKGRSQSLKETKPFNVCLLLWLTLHTSHPSGFTERVKWHISIRTFSSNPFYPWSIWQIFILILLCWCSTRSVLPSVVNCFLRGLEPPLNHFL